MDLETQIWDSGRLIINAEFASMLRCNRIESADALWHSGTEPVKEILKERGTGRLLLKLDNSKEPVECYVKRYRPVPLREKLKNILYGKQPSFDAFHEWKAILKFHSHGLATMTPIAVASHGGNTCLMTLGIRDYVRASELLPDLADSDHITRRHNIIRKIAKLAGTMHRLGIAHQDFYLVHLFIKEGEDDTPYIIDLQRTITQPRLSRRWRVKDLAQLLFSSASIITQDDIAIFWETYKEVTMMSPDKAAGIARAVYNKASRMAKRHNRKEHCMKDDQRITIPSLSCL